jgi:hypothetical protein
MTAVAAVVARNGMWLVEKMVRAAQLASRNDLNASLTIIRWKPTCEEAV